MRALVAPGQGCGVTACDVCAHEHDRELCAYCGCNPLRAVILDVTRWRDALRFGRYKRPAFGPCQRCGETRRSHASLLCPSCCGDIARGEPF